MKSNWTIIALTSLLLVLVAGCTQPYRITYQLEAPLASPAGCTVGAIADELPLEMAPEDKPTQEQMDKFRGYIANELSKSDLFGMVGSDSLDGDRTWYEVTGGVIDYKRGSGWLRFLIGFGAGNAQLTVRLALVDRMTKQTVFEANFKRVVSDWAQSGDKTFENVAKDFTKALKKEMKRLRKEQR